MVKFTTNLDPYISIPFNHALCVHVMVLMSSTISPIIKLASYSYTFCICMRRTSSCSNASKMPLWQVFIKGLQGRTYTININNPDPKVLQY